MTRPVRVRYAPSPTGHLHIGNARTALFNYLFARHHGGKLIIRIEDTDLKRNIAGGEESQLKYLKWLGISWDESIDIGGEYGPYRQTERLDIYTKHAQDLIDRGLAYHCYCTEEELEQEREAQAAEGLNLQYSGKCRHLTAEQRAELEAQGRKPSIRFNVDQSRSYTFDDIVKGEITFDASTTGDWVIIKKDGIATYNFAVVIDDYLMQISHVLRGEDHVTNTLRQLMIYDAFGWEAPIFGHMTLIVSDNGKKLSKRDESIIQFIEQYDDLGFLPEAMFNFISLLGWSPKGEQEIYSREELIEVFDEQRLSKSPAVFDKNKLNHLNNSYIKNTDPDRLTQMAIPHLQKANLLPATLTDAQYSWTKDLVKLYQEQMNHASEIVELSELFFQEELNFEAEAAQLLQEEHVPTVVGAFLAQITQTEEYTPEIIAGLLKNVQKDTGYKGKQLFMSIRVALTGQMHGRDLNMTIYLLGKEKVQARLQNLLS
ncbi:glutamate--tRNA ligase [Paenibacillus albiflavus]|uniref:Glutamate--tRNA ligase n=1 Tax=Paenibacillus albiflavus TaxID=2545760 RepID=A0A4R4DVQ9_9BACL|nr:glutamate--tRNA ligase [Paenibacillus albiflavus]TCZ67517.1 glutamate--tRNA ligase [Paenibacillus albiflavus]